MFTVITYWLSQSYDLCKKIICHCLISAQVKLLSNYCLLKNKVLINASVIFVLEGVLHDLFFEMTLGLQQAVCFLISNSWVLEEGNILLSAITAL